ncbi:hypothetical protein [Cellulomonas biazotea]|uniref:Uncharacterized protein n=1 Tax=Cellulomonas biazotea TaxID=1709 RepID=A0A402DU70_9CELL|nr:hypothetical protein [Cellulomonas biazotea]GCE77626.1 hypothetical protein CBZ_26820 [Cellulomonas biazotea]
MKPLASGDRSRRRSAAVGVVAATLTVAATGAAYALASADRPQAEQVVAGGADAVATADPTPSLLPQDVTDESAGPDEYTQARADAFWGAGYYMEDADALAALWQLDLLEAKGRAGQLLLDGLPVPVAPGSSLDLTDPDTLDGLAFEAYWDAGYNSEEAAVLAELWNVDVGEAKLTAGRMLRAGQPLPIPPNAAPQS